MNYPLRYDTVESWGHDNLDILPWMSFMFNTEHYTWENIKKGLLKQ